MIVRLPPVVGLSEDQFFRLCQINRDLRLERNARGELLLMPPTGIDTDDQNAEITMQLRLWAKRDGTGTAFGSSAGFTLSNGAVRSPDGAWVRRSRLDQLSADERGRFARVCPDFVIELRSSSDALRTVQAKMQEYIDNGAQLGWQIDPKNRRVYVYRPDAPVERLDDPATVSGDPLLAGFVLDLNEVW